MELCREVNDLKEHIWPIRNIYESELARIGLTTYRCFARLNQIMLAVVSRIPMPEAAHHDTSQLLYELLRNIEQLRSPYDHSKSTKNIQIGIYSLVNG